MVLRYIGIFLLLVVLITPATTARGAGRLVAAVLSSDQPRYREAHRALEKALNAKGFDQENLEIIMQNPNPDPISWANSIRKFNAIGADVVVTYGAPATLAAVRETTEVPLVFVDVYGPVDTGISRSMTTAGPNITGVSSKVPMTTLISAFLSIKSMKTIGVVYSSREVGSVVQLKEIKRIGAQLGFNVAELNVSSMAMLDSGLSSFLSQVDGLYVSECSVGCRGFERIIHTVSARKIPVVSQMPDAAEKGALLSLEVSPAEQGQLAAEYVARILAGRKPSQMPVVSPKKIEMVVNMRVAKSLDLHVPFQVLGQATRVLK